MGAVVGDSMGAIVGLTRAIIGSIGAIVSAMGAITGLMRAIVGSMGAGVDGSMGAVIRGLMGTILGSLRAILGSMGAFVGGLMESSMRGLDSIGAVGLMGATVGLIRGSIKSFRPS